MANSRSGARVAWYDIEAELRRLGLKQRIDVPGPTCRWHLGELVVDVMPTSGEALDFSNRWYAAGFATAEVRTLPSGRNIRVFSPTLYLASKVEAFESRGVADPLVSNDLEDIVTLLDACPDLESSARVLERLRSLFPR